MIDMRDLVNSAIAHQAVLKQADRDIRDNNIRIDNEQTKLINLINENKLTQFSYEYLDRLVKEESGKFIKSLNDTLNYAVKVIFYDCNYTVEIKTEDNRTSIRLRYINDEGNEVNADVKDCGGGVRTVISTVMNIFFLFKYKAEPVYLVDEGFSAISEDYLGGFLGLLNELAEKNDLKILLVTHDKRFIDYEHVANKYVVSDGRCVKLE